MQDLLKFIIKHITGSEDFEISEEDQGNNQLNFIVKAPKEIIGLIIGKEGKTIKNIRKILSIPGVLQQKSVYISVSEKG